MEKKTIAPTGLNTLTKLIQRLRNFFSPVSNDKKKIRYTQIRNASMFFAAAVLFMVFEEALSRLVSIDTSDLQKQMAPSGSPF